MHHFDDGLRQKKCFKCILFVLSFNLIFDNDSQYPKIASDFYGTLSSKKIMYVYIKIFKQRWEMKKGIASFVRVKGIKTTLPFRENVCFLRQENNFQVWLYWYLAIFTIVHKCTYV